MMMPDQLIIASHNPAKITEIVNLLQERDWSGRIRTDLDWPEIEETGETVVDNAVLKAEKVRAHTGLAALADDTGLEVEALGGRPGVKSARYAGENATDQDNIERLLWELEGVSQRTARFRTVMALARPNQETVWAEGELVGEIAIQPIGEFGFGYDPIFLVGERTLAELERSQKQLISHRARAVRALIGLAVL